VPADAVRVMVEAGHVTLTGEMAWNFQREAADRTVRKLMGVTGITNRIAIAPHVTTMTKNEQIEVDGAEFT
jgi:osmotically-inducible protein OsmY